MSVVLLSSLLLLGSQGAAMAQEDGSAETMWPVDTLSGARDVTAFGDGFLAVGNKKNGKTGKVWTSPDGIDWTRHKDDPVFKKVGLELVEAQDGGVVALGSQGRKMLAWSSSDGQSWERTTVDKAPKHFSLFPARAVAGPAGLLVVGYLGAQDIGEQRFYLSADGRGWTQVDPPLSDVRGVFESLAATDDEYLALAMRSFDDSADLYWRSPDGVEWQPFDGPSEGWLRDVTVGEDGTVVAVGGISVEDAVTPAIWRSQDLATWELVHALPSGTDEDELTQVETGGPGYVATGITSGCPQQPARYCPEVSILVSGDGIEWRSLGVADGVPGPLSDTSVSQLASNGPTAVMLAWHDDVDEVWTLAAASE